MSKRDETEEYLRTGGMGEVMGLIGVAKSYGQEKVQMDTEMAECLARLAAFALNVIYDKDYAMNPPVTGSTH